MSLIASFSEIRHWEDQTSILVQAGRVHVAMLLQLRSVQSGEEFLRLHQCAQGRFSYAGRKARCCNETLGTLHQQWHSSSLAIFLLQHHLIHASSAIIVFVREFFWDTLYFGVPFIFCKKPQGINLALLSFLLEEYLFLRFP